MPLIHRHPASPRQIAANRRNSLKSTGPRTGAGKRRVALNPFKHGSWATPDTRFREAMIERGEDPGEYERLHQDLRKAWGPANAIQALLVRDLTNLYWKKIRSERAQAATDLQAAQSLEHERKAREVAAPCHERTVKDYEVRVSGYRKAQDCEEKFQELLRIMNKLMGWVERRTWSEDIKGTLALLYGSFPTRLGKRITHLLTCFTKPGSRTPANEADYDELKRLVAEERQQVVKEHEYYKQEQEEDQATFSPGMYDFTLEPLTDQWSLMLKQDTALDRQIDAKVRLLLQLKSIRPSAPNRGRGRKRRAAPAETPRRETPLGPMPTAEQARGESRERA